MQSNNAVSLGADQMRGFKEGWPYKFYIKLSKSAKTMDVKRKSLLIGDIQVFYQEVVYGRVIGLLLSSRDIDFDNVLCWELAAYPPLFFESDGQMKICKNKSSLKKILQVITLERHMPRPKLLFMMFLLWVL